MLDCEHYDNDEIMAELGRQVVDQYIAFSSPDSVGYQAGWNVGLTGAVSYLVNAIAQYVQEVKERVDCDTCRWHQIDDIRNVCCCQQQMDEHRTCCEYLLASDHLDDAAETCPNFSEEERTMVRVTIDVEEETYSGLAYRVQHIGRLIDEGFLAGVGWDVTGESEDEGEPMEDTDKQKPCPACGLHNCICVPVEDYGIDDESTEEDE